MRKSKLVWQRKRRANMTSAERDAKRSYERDYYAKHKSEYSVRNHLAYMRNRVDRIGKASARYSERRDEINEHRREQYARKSVIFEWIERRRLVRTAWKSAFGCKARHVQRRYDEARKLRENLLMARDPTYYAFVRERNRQYMSDYRRKKNPSMRDYSPKESRRIPEYVPFGVSGIDFRSRFLMENIGTSEVSFAKSKMSS